MHEFVLRVRGSEEDPNSFIPRLIWDNFLDYVYATLPNRSLVTSRIISEELAKYDAVSIPGPHIYFMTEEARTLFLLKWS